MKRHTITLLLLLAATASAAQETTVLQQSYRERVIAYNQDLKAARHATDISREAVKSAKADRLPSLSAGAHFDYTGNPAELTATLPGAEHPFSFEGSSTKYGANLTLAQPVYTGGAVRAGQRRAEEQLKISGYEQEQVLNTLICNADIHYWNLVARQESVAVAEDYRRAVSDLVGVIRQRVETGYADRNDLLMAEVKLNEAEYNLLKAENESEQARLALNSLAGADAGELLPTDPEVAAADRVTAARADMDTVLDNHPDTKIASGRISLAESDARLAASKHLPRLTVGIDGNYGSPGFDFKSDPDFNYALYARLNIPLFEWGKRRQTRRTGRAQVGIAREYYNKTADRTRLAAEQAYLDYTRSVEQVVLTRNSLAKASESETLAFDKYKEGSISIVEVINAQLYHRQAQINHIQAKLNAQTAKSNYARSCSSYDISAYSE